MCYIYIHIYIYIYIYIDIYGILVQQNITVFLQNIQTLLTQGWLGEAKAPCIVHHRGIQLIFA